MNRAPAEGTQGFTTTARAQGRTVDTAHALIDDTTTREGLYVAATRGRQRTQLYVQNKQLLGIGAERPPAPSRDATDVLTGILAREAAEPSATEVARRSGRCTSRVKRQPPTSSPQTRRPGSRSQNLSATVVGVA